MNSYEFLKYITVNLTTQKITDENISTCTATGFYAIINNVPVIVTAKHFVLNTDETLVVPVHYKENNTVITLPVSAKVDWFQSDEYDIAYCKVKPIADKLKEIAGKEMFYTAIHEKEFITKTDFSNLNILSEVLTIGYPLGRSSTHHEFPIFKKGYIASSAKDFIEDGEAFLDLCAEEGYSGAPILLNNSQLKLVGILVKSVVTNKSTPKSITTYVAAHKILDIKEK